MDTFADPGWPGRVPFLGRAGELDLLDALLRGRAGGAGPVAVDVTGEPGIGKTRLATEFASRVRGRGADGRRAPLVLHGRAGPGPTPDSPLRAWADALAGLDHHDRTAHPELSALADLVESLTEGPVAGHTGRDLGCGGHPDESPAVAHGSHGAGSTRHPGAAGPRGRPGAAGSGPLPDTALVRRIARAVRAVPAPGLLLVLDDLHHADTATVALVDQLLRHPLRAPVLLVLVRRERQTGPGLAALLARGADSGSLTRLPLRPLTAHDGIEALAPGLSPGAARELHATSLGNPLHHRALAHLRLRPDETPGTGPAVALLDELAALTPPERAVVDALAVLHGPVTTDLLAAMTGLAATPTPESATPCGDSRPTPAQADRRVERPGDRYPDRPGGPAPDRQAPLRIPTAAPGGGLPHPPSDRHVPVGTPADRNTAPLADRPTHLYGAADLYGDRLTGLPADRTPDMPTHEHAPGEGTAGRYGDRDQHRDRDTNPPMDLRPGCAPAANRASSAGPAPAPAPASGPAPAETPGPAAHPGSARASGPDPAPGSGSAPDLAGARGAPGAARSAVRPPGLVPGWPVPAGEPRREPVGDTDDRVPGRVVPRWAAPGLDGVLRALAHRDLVRAAEDGRALVLRHPALPEILRAAIDPWHRRELHRRAARALAGAGAPVTVRAPHLVRATTTWDPEAAAQLVEAAERIDPADPARAADWLATVLALLPDTPEHRTARRDLTFRRARSLASAGRTTEARDLLHLVDAPGSGDGPDGREATELRTAAVLLRASVERQLGHHAEADALLRRELERTPGPRPGARNRLVVEWGCRALSAARYPEARPAVTRTLEEVRRRHDETDTAEVLTLAALGEAYEGATATARTHVREAAALTDALTDGELTGHTESLIRLAWAEAFLERYAAAEHHTARGAALARRAGRPLALSQLLLCSAYVHLLTGRVGRALALAEESLTAARAPGGLELLGFTRAIRAVVLLHARPLGDPEPLAAAEEAAATVGTARGWWATQARALLAYSVATARDPHRAREVLLDAGGGPDLTGLQPSLRPAYLELLVEASLGAGDLAEAERAARRALEEAATLGLPTQSAAAGQAWGRVLARRGERSAAATAFTEAAREGARSGATLREAHGLLLAAPGVRAAGDGPHAAALWRRGRRLASEGGARLLVDLADRTRPDAPDGTTGSRLAALTPREREISALVAEGLTNQAVAERLCLSPRTVESHVARVYRKTGVETRAGLASLVARDRADGVAGRDQSLRG
ncbi:AAA family ATPase [Streptomyces sp. NPDC101490]|uniref:helix-turn-helix transcriptional regulator n=1 Tax=Streptomyces sp. NPDC101490 TaxID=3366143 RepID=UPI0037F673CC